MADLVCDVHIVMNEVIDGRKLDEATGCFDVAPDIGNANDLNQ